MTAEEALSELVAGNRRYVGLRSAYPHQSPVRRMELVAGQRPFAAILGCADSRVPPEIIFDCGLGDLFVVRVAGNVVDDVVLGSIEYAVEHLDVPLVVVLGHTQCGAVQAALGSGHATGHINSCLSLLMPALESVGSRGSAAVERVVHANIGIAVSQLRASYPVLAERSDSGRLCIIGACYDLATGEVDFSCGEN